MSNEHIAEANARASVPVSQQANEAAEAAYQRAQDANPLDRPGSAAVLNAETHAAKVAAAPTVELKRFSVELRYGPQMMNASAEVSAPSVDLIMATIMQQGGLRLTSKLPTSSPAGTSFQKGAFIFTQSIHSVVIIEELR